MSWLVPYSPLAGGLYLGWTLGANDAANVFGTAVGARVIRFRTAALLCGGFVTLGAVLQGGPGIDTLSGITQQTVARAVITSVSAAITVTYMTFRGLPVSTSQAVVGSIFGMGLATGTTDYRPLIKVVICWVGTPLGAMVMALLVYKAVGLLLARTRMGLLTRDRLLWAGLILTGIYGSYALGANNVTNTIGVFSGLIPGLNDRILAAIGGLSIAVGVVTFSGRIMRTVGTGIMRMDSFTAFVAVLSMSLTVHAFAFLGAPVSASQGIVGSIVGVGLLRGVHVLQLRMLYEVVFGWILTPVMALILAAAGYALLL